MRVLLKIKRQQLMCKPEKKNKNYEVRDCLRKFLQSYNPYSGQHEMAPKKASQEFNPSNGECEFTKFKNYC